MLSTKTRDSRKFHNWKWQWSQCNQSVRKTRHTKPPKLLVSRRFFLWMQLISRKFAYLILPGVFYLIIFARLLDITYSSSLKCVRPKMTSKSSNNKSIECVYGWHQFQPIPLNGPHRCSRLLSGHQLKYIICQNWNWRYSLDSNSDLLMRQYRVKFSLYSTYFYFYFRKQKPHFDGKLRACDGLFAKSLCCVPVPVSFRHLYHIQLTEFIVCAFTFDFPIVYYPIYLARFFTCVLFGWCDCCCFACSLLAC